MTDRTVVYRLQADAQQFKAQMAAAGASVKKAADDMTGATKEGAKFRQGLDSLGGAAGKVGLVAAVGLGAAIKKAADFDQAMSNVQAATHESAAAMDSLRQAALDAGAQTAFSATEAAAGIENLAKAGVSTAEILDGGLTGALDLAAAGEMEVAAAAEAAAGAMAQFKLEGDQVPHVADLLAAAAGKAQGEVSDMVMALKQGGTVAAQTGLSLEETTGALAAMAEQSLLGSDAGTSFKTMLGSLTPNSKKAADAMELYNIHAFDAQGNFVGMTELAGQLESGLGHLTDEQRAMALETIFGSDAVRAASIIYDNGAEGIAKWTENVNDAGYAAETAAIKQDNLRGDIEKLGGALETALIGTGSSSQGPLRALTQSLEDAVNAYNGLGEGAKSGVAVTLAATAGIGGGLFIFSKMVQSIAATRVALTQLGVTATGTQAVVGAAAKGMGVALGAGLAIAAADLGDVDYSLESMNRQLELLAAQGDAKGILEGLSLSAETLGEALRDAAYNDFNMFGMGSAAEIKELDAALSGLDPTTAAETFKVLVEEGEAAGLTVADVTGLFPQYAAGLELAAKEADAGVSDVDAFAGATTDLGDAMTSTDQRAADFKDTLEQLNAELGGRASVRDYQAAIDDLRGALKDNGKTFDVNTAKGRANQAALDNIAASALKVAEGMGEADRQKFLTTAIRDLRTMGENMGLPKSEVGALIALLRAANKTDVTPIINVNTGPAMQAVGSLEARLNAISDEDVYINIRHRSDGKNTGFGPQLAMGGGVFGPGTGTSDSIPALLSNGEHVWTAKEVANAGGHAAVESLRSRFRFADGGPVGFARGGGVTSAEILAVMQAEKAIREIERALKKDGKDKLKGNARDLAQQELRVARDSLKAAQAGRGQDARDAAESAAAEQARIAQDAENERIRIAEEAADRQREINEAILEGQTRAWDQATDAAKSQVDAAKAMVDSVQANMDRIGSAATSAFGGSWFTGGDQQHGLWTGPGGGAAGDWRSKAMSSITGLQERSSLISQLSGLGLTGAGLEDLLGNQSNAGIAEMIGAGEIDDFAALFSQRQALMASVGQQAGMVGYGSEWSAANAQFTQMNAQLANLTAAIAAARPITVTETISAQALAVEMARLQAVTGGF